VEPIAVSDLVVRRGGRTVVQGVSFSAEAGEVLALLGPNGAGKTTTVETLEGYLQPESGSVRILGLDPRTQRAEVTPRVGVLLQDGGLYPQMSGRRLLRLFASYYASPADPEELIDLVGLREVATVPAKRLSGGQRRRLALAAALVGQPEVLFLDEPTAGVDPEGRLAIRGVIAALRREGVCILLTTHELDEAERLADQLVLMRSGEVAAAGRPVELLGGTAEIHFAAASGLDVAALGERLAAAVREERPGEYVVARPPDAASLAAVTSWLAERNVPLAELRAGRRLEDVFFSLLETPDAPPLEVGRRRARRR
jgi:ABC-2 type transport system ATP-binding protein